MLDYRVWRRVALTVPADDGRSKKEHLASDVWHQAGGSIRIVAEAGSQKKPVSFVKVLVWHHG